MTKRKTVDQDELHKHIDAFLKTQFTELTDSDLYHSVRVQCYPKGEVGVFIRLTLGEGKIPVEFTGRIVDKVIPAITDALAREVYQSKDLHLCRIHYLAWNNTAVVTYTPPEYL